MIVKAAAFCGKSRLITVGKSTFPIAMPNESKAVSANKVLENPSERTKMPKAIKNRASIRLRSMPNLPAKPARGENAAKIKTGREASTPPMLVERSRTALIVSRRGPTLVMGARRTEAISITPAKSKNLLVVRFLAGMGQSVESILCGVEG